MFHTYKYTMSLVSDSLDTFFHIPSALISQLFLLISLYYLFFLISKKKKKIQIFIVAYTPPHLLKIGMRFSKAIFPTEPCLHAIFELC